MNARKLTKNVLLCFVLVSIGFAAGKELTLRSVRARQGSGPTTAPAVDKTVVYYFHGNNRCATCNRIERQTREVVERDFAKELKAGGVEWRVENWEKNEALASRYKVSSSSVVLVNYRGGRETQHKRLDDVWVLVNDGPAFAQYICESIEKAMGEGRK